MKKFQYWMFFAASVAMVAPAQEQEQVSEVDTAQMVVDRLHRDNVWNAYSTYCKRVHTHLLKMKNAAAKLNDFPWLRELAKVYNYGNKQLPADLVKKLLDAGVDVNARDEEGKTALFIFGEEPPETLRVLLEAGADVNARDNMQRTPLHSALGSGEEKMFEALVAAGADLNAQDEDGDTPLHNAFCCSSPITRSRLIELGADLNIKNKAGHTPLDIALSNTEVPTVRQMLKAGATLDKERYSPLFLACILGDMAECRRLIEAGADVNDTVSDDSLTPLMLAVMGGNAELTGMLLELGADPCEEQEDGSTPLHIAADNGHVDICAALIAAGADVEAKDENGYTPLAKAVSHGPSEVVDTLLQAGAKINIRCDKKPLIFCVKHTALLQQLLAAGADINMTALGSQKTALHEAAEQCKVELVKALLAAGAQVNALDVTGYTPLAKALSSLSYTSRKNRVAETCKLLVDAGADVNAGSRGGMRLLEEVMNIYGEPKCYREAACLLLDAGLNTADAEDRAVGIVFKRVVKERDLDLMRKLLAAGLKPLKMSPLSVAAFLGQEDEVRRLLAEDASALHLKSYSKTPLMYAAHAGHVGVVRLLLEAGADVNEREDYNCSALVIGILSENEEIIDMLLKAGADVNDDKARITPLCAAAAGSKADSLCRRLLAAGAKASTVDRAHRNVLHYALTYHSDLTLHSPLCQLLISAGADTQQKDYSGRTPEIIAEDEEKNFSHTLNRNLLDMVF